MGTGYVARRLRVRAAAGAWYRAVAGPERPAMRMHRAARMQRRMAPPFVPRARQGTNQACTRTAAPLPACTCGVLSWESALVRVRSGFPRWPARNGREVPVQDSHSFTGLGGRGTGGYSLVLCALCLCRFLLRRAPTNQPHARRRPRLNPPTPNILLLPPRRGCHPRNPRASYILVHTHPRASPYSSSSPLPATQLRPEPADRTDDACLERPPRKPEAEREATRAPLPPASRSLAPRELPRGAADAPKATDGRRPGPQSQPRRSGVQSSRVQASAAMSSERVYGVTPPLSINLPTEVEKRTSDALIEELRRQKTFESPSDTEKRYVARRRPRPRRPTKERRGRSRHKVLESLQSICNDFVKRVAKEREPKNDILIKNARGKVFTYGSFRLGVFGPGSDIDTLIVAPKYVTRDDYFQYFPEMLVAMAPKGAIAELAVVRDAFVPIIKFEYSGISIDLIFSRIIQKQLSPDLQDLKDSTFLRGLDEAELRSLNGTRVTDEILNLVPEQSTFKLALRAIKLWAQRRAVYANIMGFPGGVAWAMLVARVCQLYPKAATSVIVNKFFLVISQWRWPQPVLLKPIENGPLPVRVWNPKVRIDADTPFVLAPADE